MRKSITQEFDYGCGIACFAFVSHQTYKQAETYLGIQQVESTRFWIKDFTAALNSAGLNYESNNIKPRIRSLIYQEGAIVLIKRSKRYQVGHYLVRHNNQWMDPWINLPQDRNIANAKSGYRKRLPGAPMYALIPVNCND